MDVLKSLIVLWEKGYKQIIWMQGGDLYNGWVQKAWHSEQVGRQEALGFTGNTLGTARKNSPGAVSTVPPNVSRAQYHLFDPP